MLAFSSGLCLLVDRSPGQDFKVWEYAPYDVMILVSIDAGMTLSETAKGRFFTQLEADLSRTFRAAWNIRLADMPPQLESTVISRLESFTVSDLIVNELVLAISLQDKQASTLRTFEAAVASLTEIHATADARRQLETGIERLQLDEDSLTSRLLEKLVVDEGGLESVNARLMAGEIPAALLPRFDLASVSAGARPLMTPLPWQSAFVLGSNDKLFFLTVGAEGDELIFKARELDCEMQFLGPAFESRTASLPHAARAASFVVTQAFAPAARVEEAESRSAQVLLRAGGLILDSQNPASVAVGDVMLPIVRRDDRNGVPTLLEPLSWTFAAITETNGIKMNANVYTYSGGPGLQGRKNRRTRRVLLKVRPRYENTDIKVSVRGDEGKVQSGCFVYQRDLLTDEFEFLGRTDWRGRLNISVPETYGRFLPEAVRQERSLAARAADEEAKAIAALAAVADVTDDNKTVDDSEINAAAGNLADAGKALSGSVSGAGDLYGTENDPQALPLNYPLRMIYIKNGETVLAKLPMVPGLQPVEEASLPDDSFRLEAEAFVKGFQGEILDLIGMRSLLAARVQLCVREARENPSYREAKLQQAEEVLSELGQLKTYNEMSLRLEQIQRDILESNSGNASPGTRNRIDRMFQTTRNLLQSYLQDDLLANTTSLLNTALGR